MGEKFDRLNASGKIGEERAVSVIEKYNGCWRSCDSKTLKFSDVNMAKLQRGEKPLLATTCRYKPKIIDISTNKDWQNADDVDMLVQFECGDDWINDNCELTFTMKDWCDVDEVEKRLCRIQCHEVKHNSATHSGSLDSSRERTQNLYIEKISKGEKALYAKKLYHPLCDDPRTGMRVQIRKGVGWWCKRDYENMLDENGNPCGDGKKADWYHFYQSYARQEKDEYVTAKEASRAEIEKWLDDENIPDGSVLVVRWPMEYCLSISGWYLENVLVKHRNAKEDEEKILVPINLCLECLETDDEGRVAIERDRNGKPVYETWADGKRHAKLKPQECLHNKHHMVFSPVAYYMVKGEPLFVMHDGERVRNWKIGRIPDGVKKYIPISITGEKCTDVMKLNRLWQFRKPDWTRVNEWNGKSITTTYNALVPKLMYQALLECELVELRK